MFSTLTFSVLTKIFNFKLLIAWLFKFSKRNASDYEGRVAKVN